MKVLPNMLLENRKKKLILSLIKPEDLNVVHVMYQENPETQWVDVFFQVKTGIGQITNKEPHN